MKLVAVLTSSRRAATRWGSGIDPGRQFSRRKLKRSMPVRTRDGMTTVRSNVVTESVRACRRSDGSPSCFRESKIIWIFCDIYQV